MDNYKAKIKNRMIFGVVGLIIFIPIAVYAFMRYFDTKGVVFGTPLKDFIGGLLNGLRGGIVIGFVLFLLVTLIKNYFAIRNDEKLKKMFIEENDERTLAICEHSSQVTFNITMFVILAVCVVTGLYNPVISLTLLAVWIFIILTRLITMFYYNKKI